MGVLKCRNIGLLRRLRSNNGLLGGVPLSRRSRDIGLLAELGWLVWLETGLLVRLSSRFFRLDLDRLFGRGSLLGSLKLRRFLDRLRDLHFFLPPEPGGFRLFRSLESLGFMEFLNLLDFLWFLDFLYFLHCLLKGYQQKGHSFTHFSGNCRQHFEH